MVARVDQEDYEYIKEVESELREAQKVKEEELQKELENFRNHVIKAETPTVHRPSTTTTTAPLIKKDFQKSILSGIKKKKISTEQVNDKSKKQDLETNNHENKKAKIEETQGETKSNNNNKSENKDKETPKKVVNVLPSLGIDYDSSEE